MNWCEAWYFTPIPKEYHCKCLYVCDFCLNFFRNKKEFQRHSRCCTIRHPPGPEIYRSEVSKDEKEPQIAFFEVNGAFQNIYCENLSYISRMFLDHKNLEYSIECFFFYVMCKVEDDGYHFLGYFSKDRVRTEN